MTTKVTISLPEYLQEFLDTEIAARGPLTRAEFVEQLVHKAYEEKHQERIEELLMEGINSGPATPMTKQVWEDIRRTGLERLAREKQHAAKSGKKAQGSRRPA